MPLTDRELETIEYKLKKRGFKQGDYPHAERIGASTVTLPLFADMTGKDVQRVCDAVTAVLRSEYLTQGPAVPRFEQAMATYCGAVHAVAANSATSALHIACLALGVAANFVLIPVLGIAARGFGEDVVLGDRRWSGHYGAFVRAACGGERVAKC